MKWNSERKKILNIAHEIDTQRNEEHNKENTMKDEKYGSFYTFQENQTKNIFENPSMYS